MIRRIDTEDARQHHHALEDDDAPESWVLAGRARCSWSSAEVEAIKSGHTLTLDEYRARETNQ